MPTDAIRLSLVLPVYNEEDSVREFYSRLSRVMDGLKEPYELIFIDDGSSDNSAGVIKGLRQTDPAVKLVSFSRNFGHQLAITAGVDYASGEAVIMMDTDLQHPPEIIPELVSRWRQGYEIVYTIRQDTLGAGVFKRLTSRLFYRAINRLSGMDLEFGTADFRLLGGRAVNYFRACRERTRFLRGLINWLGFPKSGIRYSADKRFAGKSKYSFPKMARLAMDGVISFSPGLLTLSTWMGIIISGLSFLYALYALYVRFFTARAVAGWTSLLIAVLFLGGVQLIFLGILGEYLSRVYNEVKARPLYVVKEIEGLKGDVQHKI